MDESEKRRERLKAVRMEAAQNTDFENPGLAPGALANPLIGTDNATASPHQYNTLPRFDYYTDPMSAFSRSKRMHNVFPHVSQGHYNTPSNSRPMDDGKIQTPAHHYPAMNSPSPGPGTAHHYPAMNSPSPGPVGSPMGAATPSYRPQQNPPSSWVGSGAAFNYNPRPNFSRVGNFPSPGFEQGRGPQGQSMSSHYDSGRGRGRGRSYGNSMRSAGSGPSFRRGSSSYYSKEMVEDPWLGLTPVLWKDIGEIDSDKSWLPGPKSIAMKKLKASPEVPQASISQQSLAEYLAASFDDSVNEAAVEDEKGT